MNVEQYNKVLRSEYEKKGGIKRLEKYVMSELLTPIEDFGNVVKIIKENYGCLIDIPLLIVGAYSATGWTEGDNELLQLLTIMLPNLSEKEKAIINYLNARQISFYDKKFKKNTLYRNFLSESIKYKGPFVYNLLAAARLCDKKEAKELYTRAISSVEKTFSQDAGGDIDSFMDIKGFISEHILGTTIFDLSYLELIEIRDSLV